MSGLTNSGFVLTLLIVNALAAVVTATVLLVVLPRHVRDYLGEAGRLVSCWTGYLLIVVMLLLPVNIFLGFIHTWVIPLPLAAQAVSALVIHTGDSDGMYGSLDVVRTRHETWAMREGFTAETANQIEQVLWGTWPLLVIIAVFLFVFGLRQLKRFHVRLANDLETYAISGQFGRLYAERLREAVPTRHRRHHRRRYRSRQHNDYDAGD
jgi:hypothetical protein